MKLKPLSGNERRLRDLAQRWYIPYIIFLVAMLCLGGIARYQWGWDENIIGITNGVLMIPLGIALYRGWIFDWPRKG